MNHACNRGTAAIFDIGCGTRDRARRRNTAKQGGNNITRALCHQLRVGTVFSADHAVRYHAGKQRLNRRQNCNRKRIRQGTLNHIVAKHRQMERRKLVADRVKVADRIHMQRQEFYH